MTPGRFAEEPGSFGVGDREDDLHLFAGVASNTPQAADFIGRFERLDLVTPLAGRDG